MENGIRAPVSLWNRNTLDGFKEKCTDPASRSTGVSAVMMERTEGFSEQGWEEITLTSRPMTSTRLKLAAKGPFRCQKHLCFILQSAECLAVDNTVSVPLKYRPDITLFLRLQPSL